MNFELRRKAGKKGPDEEDFTKLANSVDEFTSCLLDPLKSKMEDRHAFGNSLDYLLDIGIEKEQKKVRNLIFKFQSIGQGNCFYDLYRVEKH